jgi:F0F1-type ATP synthase membrane subunit b/b'
MKRSPRQRVRAGEIVAQAEKRATQMIEEAKKRGA